MKKIAIISVLVIGAFVAGILVTAKQNTDKAEAKVLGVQQAYVHLTPEQFNADLNTGGYNLLDIRTADEYTTGHLKKAKNIDYYQTQQFSDYLDTLDKSTKYLIYCRSGGRSANALQIMQAKGFKDVSDLAGGYNAWVADNLAVEK